MWSKVCFFACSGSTYGGFFTHSSHCKQARDPGHVPGAQHALPPRSGNLPTATVFSSTQPFSTSPLALDFHRHRCVADGGNKAVQLLRTRGKVVLPLEFDIRLVFLSHEYDTRPPGNPTLLSKGLPVSKLLRAAGQDMRQQRGGVAGALSFHQVSSDGRGVHARPLRLAGKTIYRIYNYCGSRFFYGRHRTRWWRKSFSFYSCVVCGRVCLQLPAPSNPSAPRGTLPCCDHYILPRTARERTLPSTSRLGAEARRGVLPVRVSFAPERRHAEEIGPKTLYRGHGLGGGLGDGGCLCCPVSSSSRLARGAGKRIEDASGLQSRREKPAGRRTWKRAWREVPPLARSVDAPPRAFLLYFRVQGNMNRGRKSPGICFFNIRSATP